MSLQKDFGEAVHPSPECSPTTGFLPGSFLCRQIADCSCSIVTCFIFQQDLRCLVKLLFLCLALLLGMQIPATAHADEGNVLRFDELYSGGGVLGLQFSEKVQRLNGQAVTIRGFMAPPLKAEASFFVLTREPVALCPFCQSDADWPDNIVVVYLDERQTFVQNNTTIEVEGVLEIGSYEDTETGFVSQMRLRKARFHTL